MPVSSLPLLRKKSLPPENARLAAVAASSSHVPWQFLYACFKSAKLGALIARTLGIHFYTFSHQEGHIAAGLWSSGLPPGHYLAVHLSGGTTELLSVKAKEGAHLEIDRIGGSSDLHAGQFVDRIGVAMGLGFPACPALEECCRGRTEPSPFRWR